MAVTTAIGVGIGFGGQFVDLSPFSRGQHYAWNAQWPNLIPGVDAITQYYVSGVLQYDAAVVAWKAGGLQAPSESALAQGIRWRDGILTCDTVYPLQALDPRASAIQSHFFTLSIDQVLELQARGNIEPHLAAWYYRRNRVVDTGMAAALQSLYFEVPDAAHIVGAGVVGALSQGQMEANNLLAEFPTGLDWWLNANGVGPVTIHPAGAEGAPISIDFAAQQWALHWTYPGYAEALAWSKRLRADPLNPDGARDASGIIITPEELTRLAQLQGVHPAWRAAYEAISYRPASIRFLRTLVTTNQLSLDDTVQSLLDLGYQPQVANRMAAALATQARLAQLKAAHQASRGWIVDAWEAGVITEPEVRAYWASQELTASQQDIAWADVTIRYKLKRVQGIIASAKRGFINGRLSEEDVTSLLQEAGIEPTRYADMITDWKQQRIGDVVAYGSAKLVAYAREGLISIQYLTQRLINLGMDTDDVRLTVADVSLYLSNAANKRLTKLAQTLAKQQAAAERAAQRALKQAQEAEKQEVSAAEKAVRQAQALLKQAQSWLKMQSSPAEMKKWLCQGLIDQQTAIDRFAALGWTYDDTLRYLETTTSPCKPGGGAINEQITVEPEGSPPGFGELPGYP